ncbi:hypothetical protein IQ269_14995 [Tychonema sp. LEGE 07199]|uniref:hypothetical protein n=1 Tax=unclassified Tychonema TaxID=2642144 RepID=UPI00187E30E6|nr:MULTISPECIES: hypothetical protein [unclassified Tychonema]MBE9122079.1 hypothetical protein [Tychonema sp. LEGE 07199]MBE9134056.1 hypothetical protein [Tychonema sp. LEGE 07196]
MSAKPKSLRATRPRSRSILGKYTTILGRSGLAPHSTATGMPMSSPVQNITSSLLTRSDNLRAAAQCSGLEEIFDRSLSRENIASPSG